MAGYKRVLFDVDENGVLHMRFLKYITKEGSPFYDCRAVGKETTKDIYEKLGEFYKGKEEK